MPLQPLRPCRRTNCIGLVDASGVCMVCGRRGRQDTRPSAKGRHYNYRWQQARKQWLDQHPLCAECGRQGRVTGATVVDHIVPHRGDMRLFDDPDNWQSLCVACHAAKTARGE